MRYLAYRRNGEARLGALLDDSHVVDLAAAYAGVLAARGVFAAERLAQAILPPDLVAFLQAAPVSEEAAREAMVHAANARSTQSDERPLVAALDTVQLLAPLRPHKIFGVRRNYAPHADEAAVQKSEEPRMFFKLAQSVIGPGEAIVRGATAKLDYEAELVIIIGKKAKGIARADGLDCVAGYALGNDVSARELQLDNDLAQTSLAKSFDSCACLGPYVVTADEFSAPPEIDLKCWVNDELRQEDNTRNLLFDVAQIVAYVAQFVTLDPGDAIYTGTPAGVGAFHDPPKYLKPGDTVTITGSGLGELVNPVVEGGT